MVKTSTTSTGACDNLIKVSKCSFSLSIMHFQLHHTYSSDPNHKVNGKDAVDAWYDEIKQHTFGVEPKTTGTGHFTQVVWKDSLNLGVGMCKNSKNQVFVVCNYDPPGNFVGKFAQSVPRVGGF